MVKASALYMVIVIALVIAVLCSSLIVGAYYYKNSYQQNFRISQLQNNAESGENILLTSEDAYLNEQKIGLYDTANDSITLQQIDWGIYDIGIVKAFVQNDTLIKVFSIGYNIDSTKWSALHIIDEDRSMSVSGKTHIRGTVYLPKAGIREAYVNQEAYQGDKRIVIGIKKNSDKTLPKIFSDKLHLTTLFSSVYKGFADSILKIDTIRQSFLMPTRHFFFKKKVTYLSNIAIEGNVTVSSDTTLYIDSTAKLKDVIIKAPAVIVGSGFKGNCQIFASDSIQINKDCTFNYPSCVAIVQDQANKAISSSINIGDRTIINGAVFVAIEKNDSSKPPLVSFNKDCVVYGEVYVPGLINIKDNVAFYGSVSSHRFIYQTSYTRYENYLINVDIDALKLSPYYLTNKVMPATNKKRKIMQWLN